MPCTLVVDTHAHFHHCFGADLFVRSAYANLQRLADHARVGRTNWQGVLMVARITTANPLEALADGLAASDTSWRVTDYSGSSLQLQGPDDQSLVMIGGQQHTTSENLEVLGWGGGESVATGRPLAYVVDAIQESGGVAIIPWGWGKWWGRRGQVLGELLKRHRRVEQFGNVRWLWLGDSAARPSRKFDDSLFQLASRLGIGVLAGTDPLAFPSHAVLAGSLGVVIPAEWNPESDFHSLVLAVKNCPQVPAELGRRRNWFQAIGDQISWQLRRRSDRALRAQTELC